MSNTREGIFFDAASQTIGWFGGLLKIYSIFSGASKRNTFQKRGYVQFGLKCDFLEKLKVSSPNSKVEEIIDVASALFSLKGYSATSLKEIADQVGLHKTSLFHYFKGKEEILMEVMDKGLREYVNILNQSTIDPNLDAEEKLRVALEKQISVICKYRTYINVGLNEIKSLSPKNREKYDTKRRQYGKRFEKIIQEIQGHSESPLFKNLNFKIVNLGILGMCNWIINWYKEDGPLGPKEISEIFFGILTQKTEGTK